VSQQRDAEKNTRRGETPGHRLILGGWWPALRMVVYENELVRSRADADLEHVRRWNDDSGAVAVRHQVRVPGPTRDDRHDGSDLYHEVAAQIDAALANGLEQA
jgi:hypothetical protein